MGIEDWIEGWLRDRDVVADRPLPDGPRVTTYNIGRGAKPRGARHATLDRVAATIATDRPDVVGLQEVHEHDLPVLEGLLAREHGLRYQVAFGPALTASAMATVVERNRARAVTAARPFDEGHYADRDTAYGIALLSLAPLTDVEVRRLTGSGEARVALRASTELGTVPVSVVVTHVSTRRVGAGRTPLVRDVQTREVLALAAACDGPVVVLGDLNQEPAQLAANVEAVGCGAGLVLANDPSAPTAGHRVIDYVLVSPTLRVVGGKVGHRGVSDHRPVTVALAPT